MPLLHYLCSCGLQVSKFYRNAKEAPVKLICVCGGEYKRQLSAPTNSSKIIVDNGFQAKATEVDLNVVESNIENSVRDFREKP
jgi:hypothetical protein